MQELALVKGCRFQKISGIESTKARMLDWLRAVRIGRNAPAPASHQLHPLCGFGACEAGQWLLSKSTESRLPVSAWFFCQSTLSWIPLRAAQLDSSGSYGCSLCMPAPLRLQRGVGGAADAGGAYAGGGVVHVLGHVQQPAASLRRTGFGASRSGRLVSTSGPRAPYSHSCCCDAEGKDGHDVCFVAGMRLSAAGAARARGVSCFGSRMRAANRGAALSPRLGRSWATPALRPPITAVRLWPCPPRPCISDSLATMPVSRAARTSAACLTTLSSLWPSPYRHDYITTPV